MNARLSLVERLRLAKAAHALALEKGEAAKPPKVIVPEYTPPEDRTAAIEAAKALERAPLCGCGIRKVICVHCLAFHCRAPGHLLHVCGAPEFSQLLEGAP